MTQDWPSLDVPARPVMLILERLRASWPDPLTLSPAAVGMTGNDRLFVLAILALQDAGWVMFEALLVGSGPEPLALDTVLTAKGRKGFG